MRKLIIGILVLTCCVLFIFLLFRPQNQPSNFLLTPGDPIDSLDGVVVYYNGKTDNGFGRSISDDGYNIGLKYQCVEFVKRYYYEHFNHKMPDSFGHAKSFFDKSLNDGEHNKKRNLRQFKNPSSTKPAHGDIIVFDATTYNPYGHVAIISKVEENHVELIQQNGGPVAPSRLRYTLIMNENKWTIDSESCLGWLRKIEN